MSATSVPEHAEFERLWREAQPVVAAYVSAMIRDRHVVDDLLQEVAMALWRKIAVYDPGKPFLAWALGMARLEVLESRRAWSRSIICFQPDLLDAMEQRLIADAVELGEHGEALRRCVRALGERAWQLLTLRYEESLTPAAIAVQLGLEANAVRVRLHRLRAELEACIERRLASEAR